MKRELKLTIHERDKGVDSLTGKEAANGYVVTFEDGTVVEQYLSQKSFDQLVALKLGPPKKSELTQVIPMAQAAQ